jgi:putative holliday junction resolvase
MPANILGGIEARGYPEFMNSFYQKKLFYATIHGMKFLGIDYGTKRIGLAVSDDGGTLAFPKNIIENDQEIFRKIAQLMGEESVEEIVVGESEGLSGKPNELMAFIRDFVARMSTEFGRPVHLEKEFMTTVEARRSQPGLTRADASAAALILQRYLDRRNNAAKSKE